MFEKLVQHQRTIDAVKRIDSHDKRQYGSGFNTSMRVKGHHGPKPTLDGEVVARPPALGHVSARSTEAMRLLKLSAEQLRALRTCPSAPDTPKTGYETLEAFKRSLQAYSLNPPVDPITLLSEPSRRKPKAPSGTLFPGHGQGQPGTCVVQVEPRRWVR